MRIESSDIRWVIVLIVFTSVSVAISCQLCILIWRILSDDKGKESITENDVKCVWTPCIRHGPNAELSELCCTPVSGALLSLIQIISTVYSYKSRTNGVDRAQPTAIHMMSNFTGKNGSLNWVSDDLVSRRPHAAGTIPITTSGVYTVYGMYTISSDQHSENGTITHQIRRRKPNLNKHSNNTETILLQNNMKRSSELFSFQTSYVFGDIFLHKGDVLYNYISNSSAVYRYSPNNVWGVFGGYK